MSKHTRPCELDLDFLKSLSSPKSPRSGAEAGLITEEGFFTFDLSHIRSYHNSLSATTPNSPYRLTNVGGGPLPVSPIYFSASHANNMPITPAMTPTSPDIPTSPAAINGFINKNGRSSSTKGEYGRLLIFKIYPLAKKYFFNFALYP